MLPIALIVGGVLGWLWWQGRIGTTHILPMALGLLGALGLAKGLPPLALAGFGGAAFLLWKSGRDARVAPDRLLAKQRAEAERLLRLPSHYNEADLDAAYREAAKQAHPDAGGNAEAIAALSAARDQLKAHLAAKRGG